MDPNPTTPQTAPREGREFPCEQCGSALAYDPAASDLKCAHCGHVQHIPQSEEEVKEVSFETWAKAAHVSETVMQGTEGERRCDGCGATILINQKLATDMCPFCGTHLSNPVQAATPMLEPWGVLPFSVPEPTARGSFRQWVSGRWFAPNDFKRMADLGRVSGLYVPYWTYDAMTFSWYRGERGDAYYVTVGSGKNRRQERRVRWSHRSGTIRHWFDDVLVCSSKGLPEKLVLELEPWDLKTMQVYRPDFLGGFRTERYQIGAREGFVLARTIMDGVIRSLVRADIGGDEQRIHSVNTQVSNVTFKHVLLPVWLAAYRYNGKTFRVLVNARTGEVQGERPWSWIKITLFVLMWVALIAAVVYALDA